MRYADIVLPLAQPLYTFAVAEGVTLCEGMAVVVPFGRSKIYTGIVWRLHDRRPDFKTVKTVSRVLYGTPLLDERQRRFWEWVADYYMCTLGEVMRVALPSLMKPSGHGEEEFAADEFRPRREWFVALAGEALTADGLAAALERMGRRAPRQREALEELAALAPDGAEVARSRLAADRTALALLVKKGLLTCIEREVAPGPVTGGAQFRLPTLSAAQRKAAEEIRAVFADRATVLLRGVTGSGKTEIYMHFAAEVLARGGQVLLLVPEIALTAQLVDRLRQVFGERVIAYHSKLTDRKRTELYLRLRDSAGGELVIGARSAIFLPLRRLELVVVDEEHDPSYKQTDPAPRYQARDCAVLMTRLLGCRTLLGSATPSLESYLNAATGKYGSVVLAERYGPSRMPQILVSDTIRAVKRGERHAHFNKLLLDRMEETLGGGGQAMLFQNRRGFAPYVECRECGWTARCPDCNVTLTLPQGKRSYGLSLLRSYGACSGQVPPLPGDRTRADGLRDGKGRGGDRPRFPRGAGRPARPRQRYLRACFPADRRGLRPGRRRYSGGDADDYQRIRFRRRGAGRCAQRRQSAQQSRFPFGGACIPTADAGGRPRRSARKSRNGRDPDR